MYFIAATGEKPMVFKALHLPDGLKLDSLTGHITGAVHKNGIFPVELVAQNALGSHYRRILQYHAS